MELVPGVNHEQLVSFAKRLVGGADAEDVVQTAYLKAHRAQGSFRGESRHETWMYAITKRCALDLLRSRKRRPEEPLTRRQRQARSAEAPFDATEPQILDDLLREAQRRLIQLPGDYQHALRAMARHDTLAGAARELAITVPALRSRLRRARAALKELT